MAFPRRGYLMFMTGIVVGIIIASLITITYYGGASREGIVLEVPKTIEITVLYSSEKQGWLEEVTPEFTSWFKQKFDIEVKINLVPAGTHETINMILHGMRPTVWSPASSIWIPYLNTKWVEEYGGEPIAREWVSLVLSPVVIAGWEKLIKRYNVTCFTDLYKLSMMNVDFKWGHPDPRLSNGGTMTVLLEFCEAAGKPPDKLTVDDVNDPKVLEFVRRIEAHAVAYGKSTGFFGKWAVDSGPDAISFFGVYESVVLENSLGALARWGVRLKAIYPSFGTLLSDHPYVILDAPWVNRWQRFVALQYLYYLLQPEVQEKAMKHGFRPSNPSVPLDSKIFNEENGVSLEIPVRVLKPPSGKVLEAILSLWEKVKNPGV